MLLLKTNRLTICELALEDAPFILELLNDPAFLRFIGDKDVKTLEDARGYLKEGPLASYNRFGFGLYLVRLKETATPIGICGLLKREELSDVDIGFAFLPQYRKQGYAFESAAAVLEYGRDTLGLDRIVAITSPENNASIRLLEKLGMRFERKVALFEDEAKCDLFVVEA